MKFLGFIQEPVGLIIKRRLFLIELTDHSLGNILIMKINKNCAALRD